ncbi:hypothetical protein C5167_041874 [Papaver somniferum]|nr:hypothetical protein C5167_041874 [Papaver somniferum]
MEIYKSIIASLENKCILVTGATGFVAKLFVEKLLRTQPNVKTLYLLIRATDAASATRRLHDEMVKVFLVNLTWTYGCGEKAGLILEEPYKMGETLARTKTILDIGMEKKVIEQKLEELRAKLLSKKEETKAMKELGLERARMFGWPNVYVFTKAMGEMLIGERRENLPIVIVRPTIVTSTIKEPFPGWVEGVKTVDPYFAGFGKGKITFFLGNSKTIMDMIPGDMVLNATIAAMVAHGDKPNSRLIIIYQVGSSNREPMYCSMIKDYAYNHFAKNPLMSKNGKPIKVVKPYCFTSLKSLQIYMDLKYNFPLKGLRLGYAILRHDDGGFCKDMERQVKFVTKLAKFNEPYLAFKARFDDSNTEKLRISVKANVKEENIFYFDPRCINWDDYFMNIHLPGLMTYVLN